MRDEKSSEDAKRVVLFSGGIDSLGGIVHCLTKYPKDQLTALYVSLGHKYNDPEYVAAMEIVKDMQSEGLPVEFKSYTLDVGMFEESDANIPGRNMYLAMVACNLGFSEINIISQMYETSIPDRTPEFYGMASKILSHLYERDVAVTTPFWKVSKTGIVQLIKEAGFEKHLRKTWACYLPRGEEPCGECSACFRRFVSMVNNGLREYWFDKVKVREKSEKYLNGDYPRGRKDEVFRALQEYSIFGLTRLKSIDT